ncbi:hypothetical protein WJX84_002355 [Apatococcus fuscideae]|uniref:Uncharacterized protein n=1 Tax=Apatococcus fuscideae TaxID=2026836 RepID=A0AAW1SYE8_9CHLO
MPNAQARGGTEKERVGQGQVEPGPVSQRHGPLHAPTPVHVQPAVGHSQANPHRPVEPRSARRTREEVRRGDEATFSVRQALFGRARSSPTIHEEGRMVVGSEPAGFTHNEDYRAFEMKAAQTPWTEQQQTSPDIVREGVSGSEMSQLPLRAVPVAGDGSGRVDNAAAWVAGQRFRGQRGIWWRAKAPPPSQAEVEATLAEHGVPHVLHPPPFYGNQQMFLRGPQS